MAMMYLMLPGTGSMPSAALSSSESRMGSTGSPFRNLGEEGRAGLQSVRQGWEVVQCRQMQDCWEL